MIDWTKKLKAEIKEWKRVLPLFDRPMATIDFETKSECNLKKHGSWLYSKHPSTEVMCLAYKLPGYDKPKLWHPAYEHLGIEAAELPTDLFAFILAGGLVEAHNAFFERVIWTHVCIPKLGWPAVPVSSWRCSASRASAAALPRDLEGACKAMDLPVEKDMAGNRLMQKLSKPRKPRKAEREEWERKAFEEGHKTLPEMPTLWHESVEEFERLWAYCIQDVVAEEFLSHSIPELPETELKLWQLDQKMNWTGIRFDLDLARKALECAAIWKTLLNKELSQITGISAATKRQQVKTWLKDNEALDLPDTAAATVDWYLDRDEISGRARRVLEILKQVNRTSTRKYQAILDRCDPEDERAHDGLMYHGASTGRWCLPGEAEVLTEQGWISFAKLPKACKIAQWKETGEVFFASAVKVEFSAPKKMLRLKGENCDHLSTLDHRLPMFSNYQPEDLKVFRAEELLETYKDLRLPVSGILIAKPLSAQARVQLMVQADGCLFQHRYHTTLELDFSKERKVIRCAELLSAAGLKFSVYNKTRNRTSFVINNPPQWVYDGKLLGPWLLEYDPQEVLEEALQWDGCTITHKGSSWSSTIEENARWIQTVAHLAGKSARVTLDTKRTGLQKPIWRVYIRDKKYISLRTVSREVEDFKDKKVYCARTETGFFLLRYKGHICITGNTGKGIQVQNFPRGEIDDMDQVCADLRRFYKQPEWLFALYGEVMELLSGMLRGTIIPADDCDLIAADYSAIEARCVLWEAGAEAALEVFKRGGDIYCDMATGIYGFEVTKKDKAERQFGKQAVLGLGYGMGFVTFLLTCRKYKIFFSIEQVKGILKKRYSRYMEWVHDYLYPPLTKAGKPDKNKKRQASKVLRRLTEAREDPKAIMHELALMKYTVDVYRSRYPEVPAMWKEQEEAAILAVKRWEEKVVEAAETWKDLWGEALPREERDKLIGPAIKAGKIKWRVEHGFLCCILPSGRKLRYRDPQIKPTLTSWGEKKAGLRFMAVVKSKWLRDSSYGGKLVENITQATARDIMGDAMLHAEDSIYLPLMTVHDEIVAEVKKGKGDVQEFSELLSEILPWASGCPITAEADRFARYRK